MFMLIFFLSKMHLACHNDTIGIKTGSNSKMTDKPAAECPKAAYFGVKLIYVRCINCSYNNYIVRRISLPFEPRCEKTGLRGFRPGPT